MAYQPDWGSMFPQDGSFQSTPNGDLEEKMQRDRLQAELANSTISQRNQYEMQDNQADFENQMKILKQSNEYQLASMRERAALQAQLIALQKGDLSWRQANAMVQGGEYDAGGSDAGDILALAGGAGGAYAGYKNRAALSKGLQTAGKAAGNFKATNVEGVVSNLLNKTKLSTLPQTKNASTISRILKQGGLGVDVASRQFTRSAVGKAATGLAEKGLMATGAKAAGKVGGAIVGGIPGFLIGTAVGEVISRLLESDDEKDRAKAQFMLDNYR